MAVTCSFEKSLGKALLYTADHELTQCDVWGGGNCLLVITWGKGKYLQLFFSDIRHLKNCCKDNWVRTAMHTLELYPDVPNLGQIVTNLSRAGVHIIINPREAEK